MAISLKAARVNAGLTQHEAAKKLHISKATLASYEAGRTLPSIEMAQKIAKLYQMDINNIFFAK